MTGKDVLYIGATLAAGFVAFKVYKAASAAVDAGSTVVDAVTSGAKKVITEDLNPASDKNIVYSGLSKITTAATGQENSFGTWLYSVFNDEPDVTKVDNVPDPKTYDTYDYQGAPAPASAVTYNKPQAIQETAQTSFRLSELNAVYETKFDKFLKTIAGQ